MVTVFLILGYLDRTHDTCSTWGVVGGVLRTIQLCILQALRSIEQLSQLHIPKTFLTSRAYGLHALVTTRNRHHADAGSFCLLRYAVAGSAETTAEPMTRQPVAAKLNGSQLTNHRLAVPHSQPFCSLTDAARRAF